MPSLARGLRARVTPMCTSSRIVATCALLGAITGCASPGARRAVDARERPAVGTPMEAAAPAPAGAPSSSTPARFVAGVRVLDAALVDAGGAPCGALLDLVLEQATGEVIGVVVELHGQDAGARRVIVDYGALAWRANGARLVAVLGDAGGAPYLEDVDFTELSDGGGVASVSGHITELQAVVGGAYSALVMKVRDGGNLLHRVLVEPANLVTRSLTRLTPGQPVGVEGFLTRDAKGKLLIAKTVSQDGVTLTLRDPSGAVLCDDLARRFRSARSIADIELTAADGERVPLDGWILDRSGGVVACLRVEIDGQLRALPWGDIERDAQGAWRTRHDLSALAELPPVPVDGRAIERP